MFDTAWTNNTSKKYHVFFFLKGTMENHVFLFLVHGTLDKYPDIIIQYHGIMSMYHGAEIVNTVMTKYFQARMHKILI